MSLLLPCTFRRSLLWLATLMMLMACSASDPDPTTDAREASPDEPTPAAEQAAAPTTTMAVDVTFEERRPFKGGLFGQPSYLAPLPYRTGALLYPFEFAIPETEARVRWNGLHDLERQMVMLLTPPEPVPGPNPSALPGMSVAITDSSIEDTAAAIEAATPNGERFLIAEEGQLLGREAVIITGQLRQDVELIGTGEWSFDLPDGTSVLLLQQPERDYLMYLLEVEEQVVIIGMNAHPEQFDLVVTEALRVIETMSFLQ